MKIITTKEKLYKPEEVKNILRLKHIHTIYNYVCSGRLECLKIGNRLLFRERDINKLLKNELLKKKRSFKKRR